MISAGGGATPARVETRMPKPLPRPIQRASWRAALLLAAALAACGGGSSQNLALCGNGRLDPGEQCDDGNTIDTDACTGVCRDARCGDGAIQAGVEVCDGTNIGFANCGNLGYAPGGNGFPGCASTCDAFDLSRCGPAFTPTPVVPTMTATRTPTNTPTASPTATLPPSSCGNGLLQPGETCVSCPVDCEVAACTPSGSTFTFAVALGGARAPTDAAVELAYRSAVISIPGSGNDVTVRQRVRFAPPPPTTFVVNDRDYAVDIASMRANGLPAAPSPFATARFDGCSGAAAPTVDDLSCIVIRCADASGTIGDCRCIVTAQP